ncbi:hypothetical protein EDC01DRAFT_784297 [Geopyxis carbonaria]|nr:hypothetical protein EDC01DRAFT_784297 [Geopyxis carbonaria]
MSEMLPMELMWVCFPTQTPRNLLPAEGQRVQIVVDHGNGGIQLRSATGALVGWIDPLDDARAMRVLKFVDTLAKGGRVGGVIKKVTVGWPNAGPRLLPAEGEMTMRLLVKGDGVFDGEKEKAVAKAKATTLKALTKGKMAVKTGTAVKASKGVKGGRIVKKRNTKAKSKGAAAVSGMAKAGAVKMGEKDEGKTIPKIPGCDEEK